MFKPLLSSAALILLAASAPAFATTAAPAAPAAKAPAAQAPNRAAQSVTRAAVSSGRDSTFKKIDTNGDGNITALELSVADAGIARARLEGEFGKLDTNKDNQLSKAEFLAAAPQPSVMVANMGKTIAALDANKDGKVTADEFRAPQLSVFDKLDTNHDGTLSVAERQAGAKKK